MDVPVLTCPLCRRRSPERSTRCDCGYTFRTGTLVAPSSRYVAEHAAALKRAARTVNISAAIGVGAIAAMVALAVLGTVFNSPACLVASLVVLIPGVLVAVVGMVSGALERRRVSHASIEPRLPEARIVKHTAPADTRG